MGIVGSVPAILDVAAEGPPLITERDATDLISDAWSARAGLVAIPTARLGDDFFRLATGLAGAFLQKFVNYQMRVAIVGDIADRVAKSEPLRAFVEESNRGQTVWFTATRAELDERLAG